jgi:hypothetical protein
MNVRFWLVPLVAVAASLAAEPARAQSVGAGRVSLDWEKLAQALRNGGDSLLPHEQPWRPPDPNAGSTTVANDLRWAPHLSLVARDWCGAQLLVGRLSLTDQIRLSRSVRMVVSRVRLVDGRVAPFAQVGLGQWRVDNDLMPGFKNDTELAGQIGGGFEWKLAWRSVLAIEVDYTVLYRETRAPQPVYNPYLLGAFLATRTVF